MKKLLYIPVNTKPEPLSTSKTIGREFINRFMKQNTDYELIELDICNENIPELNYRYFKGRSELVTGPDYDALSPEDKAAVDRINQLCDQFLSADLYVIAAPMWSVLFPARLVTYIDCIVQNHKVIEVTPEAVTGLLDDKERKMVYIQSSGGKYPKLFSNRVNHGTNYLHDIFTFLGISQFEKLLVEGMDTPEVGKEKAMQKAIEDMDSIISML